MFEEQERIETALERFNKEFERMENNFERVLNQQEKISGFIENQKRIFRNSAGK